MDPIFPFPLHAPSLYTMSQPDTSSTSGPKVCFFPLLLTCLELPTSVENDGMESDGAASAINFSAVNSVENFWYFASGKPLICASHSALQRTLDRKVILRWVVLPSSVNSSISALPNGIEPSLCSVRRHFQSMAIQSPDFWKLEISGQGLGVCQT